MKKGKFFGIVAFAIILLGFLCLFPLPIYIETVGKAQNVAQYVRVAQKKDRTAGSLMLTYVSVARATPVLYGASFFDKYASRLPEEEVSGNETDSEYERVQTYYMEDAVNQAKAAALRLAGKKYQQKYLGIYVLSLLQGSTFKNKLAVGDTVTAVDGQHFSKTADFVAYLAKQKVRKQVTVTYLRNGKQRTVSGKTMKLPGTSRTGIGISLAERSQITTSEKITTDMEGIGGPSAGLMLALQMYSQLANQDLKLGRKIAGTGTISADGTVGEIGGIDKKVVAAQRAGATLFFAPNNRVTAAERKVDAQAVSNYKEAQAAVKKYHLKLKVVPVTNIKDALHYLKTH
ncbi:SepM family pheromone-processing serine protease [Liquorilactobacillus satsumensis]|uniref:endopeptidase La n=1 Tax=Liquorilactobacillus satsumensis DSM 16230 = JCM 12392 TaxID=1423801 RepID=A0A0R1V312_9LACO|nr:SepM family pheromone-processing serine protease [Liquorilactobacillus satsumensis]KRL99952.1 ATP-dependent protease La [Liquorilactobacillus satsumensis DSM 16230 = JCM 12392]MCP9328432.1 PDZ domain-containing protein [Liquorilactobacillus satsumensis]